MAETDFYHSKQHVIACILHFGQPIITSTNTASWLWLLKPAILFWLKSKLTYQCSTRGPASTHENQQVLPIVQPKSHLGLLSRRTWEEREDVTAGSRMKTGSWILLSILIWCDKYIGKDPWGFPCNEIGIYYSHNTAISNKFRIISPYPFTKSYKISTQPMNLQLHIPWPLVFINIFIFLNLLRIVFQCKKFTLGNKLQQHVAAICHSDKSLHV